MKMLLSSEEEGGREMSGGSNQAYMGSVLTDLGLARPGCCELL
jgi:hypothetical protein